MMLLASLALALSNGWVPTCTAKDSPSLWFVFEGKPPAKDAPSPPEFVCPGLFLEGVACGASVGMGKVVQAGENAIGQPEFELRYLPNGDTTSVIGFLNKEGGGVKFKPLYTPATPSVGDPPPDPAELLRQYLVQRYKASQPTQGIVFHGWTCPAATFLVPTEEMEPNGMQFRPHTARAPT